MPVQQQLDPAVQMLLSQLLKDEGGFVGPPSNLAGPQAAPLTRISGPGPVASSLSSDPTRDLGVTDDVLDLLSSIFGGKTQTGFRDQGNKDFPGLNLESSRAQAQHLGAGSTAAPIIGPTGVGIGGGLIEIFENLTKGTNQPTPLTGNAETDSLRFDGIRDTTLDFFANQLSAGGASPESVVTAMNTMQANLARMSPEEMLAVQEQIAPIASPISRAAGDPLSITSADEGLRSLLQTLSGLFGTQ